MQISLYKIILLLLISVSAFAQTPNELDNIYTPGKNSLFNSEGNTAANGSGEIIHVFKFNPLLLTRSIFALNYERALSDEITFQGALGNAFGKDWFSVLGSEIFNDFDFNKSSVGLYSILSDGDLNSKINLYTSLSARFYLNSGYSYSSIFDGTYLEFGIRYNSTSLKLPANRNGDPFIYGNSDVLLRNTSYNLIWGYQTYTTGSLKTTHDFYWGIGVKKSSYDGFESREMPYPNSYGGTDSHYVHVKTNDRVSRLLFSTMIGYVFGFGF